MLLEVSLTPLNLETQFTSQACGTLQAGHQQEASRIIQTLGQYNYSDLEENDPIYVKLIK